MLAAFTCVCLSACTCASSALGTGCATRQCQRARARCGVVLCGGVRAMRCSLSHVAINALVLQPVRHLMQSDRLIQAVRAGGGFVSSKLQHTEKAPAPSEQPPPL
eukprot:3521741-Amphidinium_carterae.1